MVTACRLAAVLEAVVYTGRGDTAMGDVDSNQYQVSPVFDLLHHILCREKRTALVKVGQVRL